MTGEKNREENAVEIRGLRKAYGNLIIYDDFSFDIPRGTVTALTGPSGCGKTTLLRMIAGLEAWEAGVIRRPGEETSSAAGSGAGERGAGGSGRTAFVFQEDRLLPWLTVRGNLELVLQGKAAETEKARMEEILDLLELSGFGGYFPDQLSGGMQRRAAIGRALLCGGELLLMDEPFKGLDDALKSRVMEALAREWRQREATVVLVTHDCQDAGALAGRIWELSGRPVQAAPLKSV